MAESNSGSDVLLGKDKGYPDVYAPGLLCPVPRSETRAKLGLTDDALPFQGCDLWTAFELSWLNAAGKPQVAMANFHVPASSSHIIESKSFKYYLNSLNQSRFDSWKLLSETLVGDLSEAAGGPVEVALHSLEQEAALVAHLPGQCVDGLDVAAWQYQPDPTLLAVEKGEKAVGEALYSHLLKTNCPVTGQPDWATLWVQYSGPRIDPASFLAYVVSFRQHQDFHENCVEKMFCDIQRECRVEELTVYARYTRRGGLDINPFRTNTKFPPPEWRLVRQ